jgi:hypothetical protein
MTTEIVPAPNPIENLLTEIQQLGANEEFLKERLAELELALEDQGWFKLNLGSENEFSRDGLYTICRLARLMYLKSPVIQRGVQVQAHYVFGQGVSIHVEDTDTNLVLQRWLADARNKAELTGHQARMMKERELQVEGNIFLVLFTHPVTGQVLVRSIPVGEVKEIITDPEDAKTPRYYKRAWRVEVLDPETGNINYQDRSAFYPDWRYRPKADEKLDTIAGHAVLWDAPVYHIKVGGFSDMRFGVSEIYAALDWARAYKEFLEDWATLTRAYSRFAHKLTTKGGAKGVQMASAKLNATGGPPLVGSTFIGGEGTDLTPMRIGGANVSAEDGRRLMLMIAAAQGLPETFYGDASVGTVATAKSLDRPTELKMRDRQTLWAEVHKDLVAYMLWRAATAPQGPLKGVLDAIEEKDGTPRLVLEEDDLTIHVDYPPLLEHDVAASVNSVTQAAPHLPNERLVAKLLLSALGEDDVSKLLDEMFPEDGDAPEAGEDEEPEETPTAEAIMTEATRELRDAIATLVDRWSK